jgi:hypothetical protein
MLSARRSFCAGGGRAETSGVRGVVLGVQQSSDTEDLNISAKGAVLRVKAPRGSEGT